jgi:hypothetical protein
MPNENSITCFTDLKSSTQLTEQLGNAGIKKYRDEHLKVGKLLAVQSGGKYIKNIGDAHMVSFQTIESALKFTAQLQQFYYPQPNFLKAPLEIRIGLFLGVVEPVDDDIFGSGINQAARVEGVSQPGEIWLNKDLVNSIKTVWGKEVSKYFKSKGSFELKGIHHPQKQKLFSFDWFAFITDKPEYNLSQLIYKHFQDASIIVSNISISDISNPAYIIWPVVPRDGVNVIHRGQLEMIRLLALLGWKVHVLIADCGAKDNPSRTYSEKFKQMINQYGIKRDLHDIEYSFMSDLFTPRCKDCNKLHGYFQSVISDLTLEDLLAINQKEYAESVRETIKKSVALDFLRPALTISSVLYLSNLLSNKSIVVVGYDEHIQWERAHAIPDTRSQFGVLFNPILKQKKGFQGKQTKNWPLYFSWEKIVEEMQEYELSQWLTKMHLFLPNFPATFIEIKGKRITPEDWQDIDKFESKIDKSVLAKTIFDNIISI